MGAAAVDPARAAATARGEQVRHAAMTCLSANAETAFFNSVLFNMLSASSIIKFASTAVGAVGAALDGERLARGLHGPREPSRVRGRGAPSVLVGGPPPPGGHRCPGRPGCAGGPPGPLQATPPIT
eukprot:7629870-Alexandrium_andersonii.AAC.1